MMPYNAEISRANPTCFIFLVDQSASMRESFQTNQGKTTKAEAVANAINKLLQNLVSKSTKSDGIRDYYHIALIGYGGMGVKSALGGNLQGKEMVPISLIGNYPVRVEERVKQLKDARGNLITKKMNMPVWLEPIGGGGTPMCAAFDYCNKLLAKWLSQYPNCFPPLVVNITDGESTDGDPTARANQLKQLSSSDGKVLLLNIHISATSSSPVEYPENDKELADDFARQLFGMSSTLTSYMVKVLSDEGFKVSPASRGFVFNANFEVLIRFIDIGTRPSNICMIV